jgi:diaminohydroxyphosphoribosylaminopyrimidine deaminase / 5-amino-6-(5-phosphoribosylamino)uracil reductase
MSADVEFAAMRLAVGLSAQGVGTTSPNPPVGCVILDSAGQIVGAGYHRRKGESHAEVNALAAAGPRARHGTAVVTLEPCNHYGRTPPCSQALLDARISRVVVALLDPTSRGEGGVAILRAGGVSVEVGVLEDEALLVLGDWRRSLDCGPQVTWVYALSAGGEPIPPPPGSAAADDAARLCQLSDVVVYDDLTLSEGVPGGHEWNLPKATIEAESYGPDILSWLATCGARTVVILGGSRPAARFVEFGLVTRTVTYLPSSAPSSRPEGEWVGSAVPAGFHLTDVVPFTGWMRLIAKANT